MFKQKKNNKKKSSNKPTSNNANINSFNNFITQSNSLNPSIFCDETCQTKRKKEDLKLKYDQAQNNLTLAQPQYENSKKNYYTYLLGLSGYNEMVEQELQTKVDTEITKLKTQLTSTFTKIQSQIDTYNGLLINTRNVADLYENYKLENKNLAKELKDDISTIATNERKTFYQNQEIETIKSIYYSVGLIIYYFIVAFYSYLLINSSNTNFIQVIIIVLAMFFDPIIFFIRKIENYSKLSISELLINLGILISSYLIVFGGLAFAGLINKSLIGKIVMIKLAIAGPLIMYILLNFLVTKINKVYFYGKKFFMKN